MAGRFITTKNGALVAANEPRVHLFHDWKGRKQKVRNGRLVDNTLCASNHGMDRLLTTIDPQRVTCKRCLKAMPLRSKRTVDSDAQQEYVTVLTRETSMRFVFLFLALLTLWELHEIRREVAAVCGGNGACRVTMEAPQ